MTAKETILSRFTSGTPAHPVFLPDFTLWYHWHKHNNTLPEKWKDLSPPEISQELGFPAWMVVRPWKIETPDVNILTKEEDGERIIHTETSAGTLVARWSQGQDGDWWQVEYPVKRAADLETALILVKSRTYSLDNSANLTRLEERMADKGVLAIELPRRPYSDLLHDLLGWAEGLMLLNEPIVKEILVVLEEKLQQLVEEVTHMPGQLVFSPDNLDGQFISPRACKKYLIESYRQTADLLHQQGKQLIVHIGGPVKRLLNPLATAGVDGIEGISGPPQSDTTLTEARELAGSDLTLWGGIPQDVLFAAHEQHDFETAVKQAAQEARHDNRVILGIADRIPVTAELSRLEAISDLMKEGF